MLCTGKTSRCRCGVFVQVRQAGVVVVCLYRYYAAFPSLSDKCDLLAGTCGSSPVEPAWSRIAQTHPKVVADDSKVVAVDSGVNSAHDDSPVDDSRAFRGNFHGGNRRHRKPHDGRRRKPCQQRRPRPEWGAERNSSWPASIYGLPWLCSAHAGGRVTYWPLQPSCVGFSRPVADDWPFPESYKDRFSDLARNLWTRPLSYEEERVDPVAGLAARSNQDAPCEERATQIVPACVQNTSELGNNLAASPSSVERDNSMVSSGSRSVADSVPSESGDAHSSNDEQAVVADRLAGDLGNSLLPHDVCLSVLQSGGFGLTLDADPCLIGGGIQLEDDDPFLGCRPLDPELWSILNSARMWCGDSSLSGELHLMPQSSERDSLFNIGLRLFEVDSSCDWSDVGNVLECSGCFDTSDSFSLLSLRDDFLGSPKGPRSNSDPDSRERPPVNIVDRLTCAETLGNEPVWDGSRIAEAVLENDAVVAVLGAEAVRQIWQPGSSSGNDRICASDCEVDSSFDSTSDCQLSNSHCRPSTTPAAGGFVETRVDEHCFNEFTDWSNRCHCVSCIWQCEGLLSSDVSATPNWTVAVANQDSDSHTDDSIGKHDVPALPPSLSESPVIWGEVSQDCEKVKASLMWDCKLFSLDCLGPASVDCSNATRLEICAESRAHEVLTSSRVSESSEPFSDLLAAKTRRWFSLLQSRQDEMKAPELDDRTEKQEDLECRHSEHSVAYNIEEQVQSYGSSTEADETRQFLSSSATEVERNEYSAANVDSSSTRSPASAAESSGCGACASSCPPISSALADLLEENNNISCAEFGAPVAAADDELAEQLPSLGSVSDIVFSDTEEDPTDSDLSSPSSVFDVSAFGSPEPDDGDETLTSENGGSLRVLDGSFGSFDRVLRLDIAGDLSSAAQCYIGSFLAPLYAVDGSSLWFRDSHYISANGDALSRLHSGVMQLLPSVSMEHETVSSVMSRSDHLLPSENTAFRDSIPQRLEPLAQLPLSTNAVASLPVHQSSKGSVSPWLSADESLTVAVMTNRHQFRPIGTPSTTDSDQSETSTATTEAVTAADSLSDFAALVMADMFADPHGTYQRFVVGNEYDEDGSDVDGGASRRTFQPSFKVQCELEKAAQTGEPSPPVSASADVHLGCLVKQVLSQLSGEFPEASSNLDDFPYDPDDTANDASRPEEQSTDEASIALSRRLSVIWNDGTDAGGIVPDSCPPEVSVVSSQVSQIWTDSATAGTGSPSFVAARGRQFSGIWSDAAAPFADVGGSSELLSSGVSDIWKNSDQQMRTKAADRLRRMWKSVDSDDAFAISDGGLFKPQSIWSQSRPNSVTPEVQMLHSVLEDADLVTEECGPESCGTEDRSDDCNVSPSELDIFWGATCDQKSPPPVKGTDAEAGVDGRRFHGGGLSTSLLGQDNIWSRSDVETCGVECSMEEVKTLWNVDPLYCSGNQRSTVPVTGGHTLRLDSGMVDPPQLWTHGEANVGAGVAFAFTHLVSGVVSSMFSHFYFFIYILKNIFKFPFCLQCFDAVGWVAGRASGL